jgi:creatinine amidohydrolase/Fe(II)-dependent formamide hydrolase-like protein
MWIRRDKFAASDSTQQSNTGVDGDPTRATAALGRVFIEHKVQNAVDQIRRLRTGGPVTAAAGLPHPCS